MTLLKPKLPIKIIPVAIADGIEVKPDNTIRLRICVELNLVPESSAAFNRTNASVYELIDWPSNLSTIKGNLKVSLQIANDSKSDLRLKHIKGGFIDDDQERKKCWHMAVTTDRSDGEFRNLYVALNELFGNGEANNGNGEANNGNGEANNGNGEANNRSSTSIEPSAIVPDLSPWIIHSRNQQVDNLRNTVNASDLQSLNPEKHRQKFQQEIRLTTRKIRTSKQNAWQTLTDVFLMKDEDNSAMDESLIRQLRTNFNAHDNATRYEYPRSILTNSDREEFNNKIGDLRGKINSQPISKVRENQQDALNLTYNELRKLEEDEAISNAKDRYMWVLSNPRVMTALGLHLNFEVDLPTSFTNNTKGKLIASLGTQGPATAFRYFKGQKGLAQITSFQPASKDEWDSANIPSIEFGYINPKNNTASPRFSIASIDSSRLVRSSFAKTTARAKAIAQGDNTDRDLDRLPPMRSPGFEVIDNETTKEKLKSLVDESRTDKSNSTTILYADDLLVGYRVDIEREPARSGLKRWASAVSRTVSYTPLGSTTPLEDWKDRLLRQRDDGSVRPLIREINDEAGTIFAGKREIFLWTGESLGLPSHDETGDGATVVSSNNQISVEYNFNGGNDGKLPVLRVGDGYRFALRACFRHGGGPTFFADTASKPNTAIQEVYAFGDKSNGVTFEPVEPTPAPIVQLKPSPLVGGSNTQPGPVVLSEKLRSLQRVLLPPTASFDLAEMQHQFDDPEAIDYVNNGWGTYRKIIRDTTQPLYIDRKARVASILLRRSSNGPGIYEPCWDLPLDAMEVEFWDADEHPNNAKPILLTITRSSQVPKGAKFKSKTHGTLNYDRITYKTVEIEIAEGDEIDIVLTCYDNNHPPQTAQTNYFDTNQLLTQTYAGILADNKHGRSFAQQSFFSSITSSLKFLPNDALCDIETIKVVSAVQQPITPPVFINPQTNDTKAPFSIYKALPTDANDALDLYLSETKPKEPFVDAVGEGSIGFLAGTISVPRRSTANVRLLALWRNFDDAICLRPKKEKIDARTGETQEKITWEHHPVLTHREFLPPLPVALPETLPNYENEEPNDHISLLYTEGLDKAKRYIHFDLGVQAIRLGIQLIGVSRFKSLYRDNPEAKDSWFEKANYDAQDHFNKDLPKDDPAVVWIPCSQRPPRPELCEMGIELINRIVETCRERDRTESKYRWSFRIRLVKGTWFKSGEGELLGLVLFPENLVSDESSSDSEVQQRQSFSLSPTELRNADLLRRSKMHDFPVVSAWGTDPTTDAGGHLEPIINSNLFTHEQIVGGKVTEPGWSIKASNVLLPVKSNKGGEINVSVLGYRPELDPLTGERFVDIDVAPLQIDSPFFKLSVCRFQPNSIVKNQSDPPRRIDLRLSEPVVLGALQIPPWRDVVTKWVDDKTLEVTITGPAYLKRWDWSKENDPQNDLTDSPWMRIRVMRLIPGTGDTPSYVQIPSAYATEMVEEITPVRTQSIGTWSKQFKLKRSGNNYKLFIEEFQYDHVRGKGLPSNMSSEVPITIQPPAPAATSASVLTLQSSASTQAPTDVQTATGDRPTDDCQSEPIQTTGSPQVGEAKKTLHDYTSLLKTPRAFKCDIYV